MKVSEYIESLKDIKNMMDQDNKKEAIVSCLNVYFKIKNEDIKDILEIDNDTAYFLLGQTINDLKDGLCRQQQTIHDLHERLVSIGKQAEERQRKNEEMNKKIEKTVNDFSYYLRKETGE